MQQGLHIVSERTDVQPAAGPVRTFQGRGAAARKLGKCGPNLPGLELRKQRLIQQGKQLRPVLSSRVDCGTQGCELQGWEGLLAAEGATELDLMTAMLGMQVATGRGSHGSILDSDAEFAREREDGNDASAWDWVVLDKGQASLETPLGVTRDLAHCVWMSARENEPERVPETAWPLHSANRVSSRS
jgi:hypothetical protein